MRCMPRACSVAEIIATTERLILRKAKDEDLAAWMVHLNTPAVTAHLGGPRTEAEVAEKFARMNQSWDGEGFAFMVVTRKNDGLFLGTCGIGRIEAESAPDELRNAVQIGWTLRSDHWGHGYAGEAAQAVLAFGFDQVGLDIIYSQTSQSNAPSWRLMERLDMMRRADLDYVDTAYPPEDNPTIIYALGADDWRARAQ